MFLKNDFKPEQGKVLPNRAAVLLRMYRSLCGSIGQADDPAARSVLEWAAAKVPRPLLSRILQSDPSVCAILPTARVPIALGLSEHAPFLVNRSGLLLLPPVLLGSSGALAATVRWGLEAAQLFVSGSLPPGCNGRALACTLRHGAALIRHLCQHERILLLDLLPDWVAATLAAPEEFELTSRLLAWQASRVEILSADRDWSGRLIDPPVAELSLPLERILATGGDSRLTVDLKTGLNRYGTVPRPRPEAVHFSSSTASSISDYGFTRARCSGTTRCWLRSEIKSRSTNYAGASPMG